MSRECLEIAAGQSMKGYDVVDVLDSLRIFRSLVPDRIQVDNGSEFVSKAMDKWARAFNVILDFSRRSISNG